MKATMGLTTDAYSVRKTRSGTPGPHRIQSSSSLRARSDSGELPPPPSAVLSARFALSPPFTSEFLAVAFPPPSGLPPFSPSPMPLGAPAPGLASLSLARPPRRPP